MQFEKTIKDDSSVLMFAKMQIEGHGTGLEKSDWVDIIKGRAADVFPDAKTPEIAFSKVITEDETGKLLYKALRAAPGSEIKPEPIAKARDIADQYAGMPEHAKLHSEAIDHQRAHPGMSYQSAWAHLYTKTDPQSVARRERVKAEHLARTLTIQEAQRLEPAPSNMNCP